MFGLSEASASWRAVGVGRLSSAGASPGEGRSPRVACRYRTSTHRPLRVPALRGRVVRPALRRAPLTTSPVAEPAWTTSAPEGSSGARQTRRPPAVGRGRPPRTAGTGRSARHPNMAAAALRGGRVDPHVLCYHPPMSRGPSPFRLISRWIRPFAETTAEKGEAEQGGAACGPPSRSWSASEGCSGDRSRHSRARVDALDVRLTARVEALDVRLTAAVGDVDRRLARLEGWIEGERAGRTAAAAEVAEAAAT